MQKRRRQEDATVWAEFAERAGASERRRDGAAIKVRISVEYGTFTLGVS